MKKSSSKSPANTQTKSGEKSGLQREVTNAYTKIMCMFCKALEMQEPIPEFRFHNTRHWRLDFAYPEHKLAIEIEGGVWSKGRHTRGSGFIADMEKYNELAVMGWRLLRFTPQDLNKSKTYETIKQCLNDDRKS